MKRVLVSVLIMSIMMVSLSGLSVFAAADDYAVETVAKIMNKTDVNNLQAKAAILMDAASGSVLLEANSHEKRPIASVTKVMSMLLIMEAIDSGKLTFEEKVPVSEYAAGMGGSQAYLEVGEEFPVSEMMKAIAVHSSNDVTVAMAEKIAGSEEAFVVLMNERAKALGMNDTHFLDCTGLTDEGHYSSAYDIAVMSRELIVNHPKILEFTSIWHDTFRNGEFSLDNTNKLIKFYQGCDGLKTGFTSKAGYNLSATAKRNNMRLISVVLGEPDTNTRFAEIRKMLDYGFANFEMTQVNTKGEVVKSIEVKKGLKLNVNAVYPDDVKLLLNRGEKERINREVSVKESLTAPVKAGEKVGEVVYKVDDREVGKVDLVAENGVSKASFIRLFFRMVMSWFGMGRA